MKTYQAKPGSKKMSMAYMQKLLPEDEFERFVKYKAHCMSMQESHILKQQYFDRLDDWTSTSRKIEGIRWAVNQMLGIEMKDLEQFSQEVRNYIELIAIKSEKALDEIDDVTKEMGRPFKKP